MSPGNAVGRNQLPVIYKSKRRTKMNESESKQANDQHINLAHNMLCGVWGSKRRRQVREARTRGWARPMRYDRYCI